MGGGGQQTSTTRFALPGWAKPYAKELLAAGKNLFMPGGQPMQMPGTLNQQVAPFTMDQLNAMNLIRGQASPSSPGVMPGTGGDRMILNSGGVLPATTGADGMMLNNMGGMSGGNSKAPRAMAVGRPIIARSDPGSAGGNMGGAPTPVGGAPTPVGGDGAIYNGPTATDVAGAGAGSLLDTLQGKYLDPNSNPWLAQTAQAATQGLVNQYRNAIAPSLMAQSIAAGGGGPGALAGNSGFQQQQQQNQYDLGQNIANLEAQIYGGAYNQERANQLGALGLLGQTENAMYTPANQLLGIGTLQQQQQQTQYDTAFQNALRQAQWPMQMLSQFGNILGQSIGGSGNQVTVGSSSK